MSDRYRRCPILRCPHRGIRLRSAYQGAIRHVNCASLLKYGPQADVDRSPYIKGLPITTTVLHENERGDHSEEVIRPTYEDPYTLEYKAWYEVLQGNEQAKTSALDGKSPWSLQDDDGVLTSQLRTT